MPIDIAYREDEYYQRRLSQAGGYIAFKKGGTPIFRFPNKGAYHYYLKLVWEKEDTKKE